MGKWEDDFFAQVDAELGVWERDQLTWHRASGAGPDAVEIALVEDQGIADIGSVAVRHAAAPGGSALLFSPVEWSAFITAALAREFNFSRTVIRRGGRPRKRRPGVSDG
ncbi:DUF397 domain-containing protein [Frankia canadensis]|uniref:DUF397 domain-containing protein n=1 Tax=Frankia canadensis TaxID=1836972 RepID=UPI001FAFCB76|nr:DUF397 domain-containing protein [Frankia canadensis]